MNIITRVSLYLGLILLYSCSKSELENHGDLSGLPAFEYQGYIYYIHNNLGKGTYSDANDRVAQLSSYGYNSWFLPKIDELMEASKHGLLKVISEEYDYENRYWSSSTTGSLMCVIAYDYSNWKQSAIPKTYLATILPMLRLRK